ncbi:SGNH/GDSL hydrolase family protein [Tenacibaculum sp.]|nr:SGNH/GDSL hydrolase family protein [Tenacibaculum sp.]
MPKIIEHIAKQNGISIKTKSLCFPNYAIVDHLNKGKVQKLISKKKFDYVIIQQGPSSQAEGKSMLINDGKIIQTLCKKNNTLLGYFMVWPSKRYYHTFDKVIINHQLAAKINNALLFPVGKIWKDYSLNNKLENLYTYDNFHPSKSGSFLAALIIFHKIHPKQNLQLLTHKDYTKWVTDKDSFEEMIKLIENQ